MYKYDHFKYPPMVKLPSLDDINLPDTPKYNYYDYYNQNYNYNYNSFNYSPFGYADNKFNVKGIIRKYLPVFKKVIQYITPLIFIIVTICTGFVLI